MESRKGFLEASGATLDAQHLPKTMSRSKYEANTTDRVCALFFLQNPSRTRTHATKDRKHETTTDQKLRESIA